MARKNVDAAVTALEAALPYLRRQLSPDRLRDDMRVFIEDILELAETDGERASARTRLAHLQAQIDAGTDDTPACGR